MKQQKEKTNLSSPKESWSQRMKDLTNRMAEKARGYSEEEIEAIVDKAVKEVRAENKKNKLIS